MTVASLFACPECHAELAPSTGSVAGLPPEYLAERSLTCTGCARSFPIVDEVYVLWSDELRAALVEGADDPGPVAVKAANARIYETVADDYEVHYRSADDHRRIITNLAATTLAEVSPDAPSVYVDIGCGPAIALGLTERFDVVVGLDVSLQNLRHLRATGAVAVLGDAERLPFAERTVGVVSCIAALHHFPRPDAFFREAQRVVGRGGVVVTAGDPSARALRLRAPARAVWGLRRPVYRALSRFRPRYHLHAPEVQDLNDVAEVHRTSGGFAEDALREMLVGAGLEGATVFYEDDVEGRRPWGFPGWKQFVLRSLSFRNPFARREWGTLSTLSRSAEAHAAF